MILVFQGTGLKGWKLGVDIFGKFENGGQEASGKEIENVKGK